MNGNLVIVTADGVRKRVEKLPAKMRCHEYVPVWEE